MKKRVLIIGAGIAGLTLANFLEKNKQFDFDIIEKSKDWKHLGYTLGIWDNGRQILKRLSLEKKFDKMGERINTYRLTNNIGGTIKLYHFEDFKKRFESVYTHIKRRDLHTILKDKIKGRIKMGTTAISIQKKGKKSEVSFSNGKKREYDIIVGADGINSLTRERIFGKGYEEYTGRRAWFFWARGKFVRLDKEVLEIVGPGGNANLFDNNGKICVVLISKEKAGELDDVKTRVERLKEHFKHFDYKIRDILSIMKPKDFSPIDMKIIKMNKWTKNNVVLIGDAAHAMEPFAGIGASMAMEDAYVLYDELTNGGDNISEILEEYEKRRKPRIELAQRQTRRIEEFEDFDFGILDEVRDYIVKGISIRHFTSGYDRLLEEKP